MANDSTPTVDQQVAERPGQTAPVPLPTGLQPDTAQTSMPADFNGWDQLVAKQGQEPPGWKNLVSGTGHVAMLTPDGSKTGDVPLPNVQKARDAGFHIAVPMTSADGQKGWVPHSKVSDAISSGFKYANDKLSSAGDELANLTSQKYTGVSNAVGAGMQYLRDKRSTIAQAVNDAVIKHVSNFDAMPPKIQDDIREFVGQGIGFYSAGLLAPGPSKIPNDVNRPLTSVLPPVGLGGAKLEPSELAIQLSRVPEKPVPVERQLAGEPGPRTLEAKAVAPGKYEVEPAPWQKQAAEAVNRGEGFSFRPVTGEAPTDGYMVEMSPEHREILDHPATAENIRNFTERNKEILNAHPNMHVGGYQNELNISAMVPDRDAAVSLAKKLDQQSIWDVKNQNEIKTGGAGKQTTFSDYPLDQRLTDAGLKPTRIQTAEVHVPPERTAGIHDTAIKAAGAVPGGIQKGDAELGIPDYAMFHDPRSGSSLMLPVDKVTPEAVSRELEKSRAQYAAAEARKVSTAELSGTENYHPELQKVIAQTKSLTDDASQIKSRAAFITPDGLFSYLRGGEQHWGVIGKGQMVEPAEGGGYTDPRIDFINQTGAIRTRFATGREGDTLHISVPKTGVSDEQITAIQKSIAQLGRHGNLVLETADAPAQVKSTTKEFVRTSDVEPMLREIGAHPEQPPEKILTAERQTPLKEPYRVEVVDMGGGRHTEAVPAFSSKDALATAKKQFPNSFVFGIEQMPGVGGAAERVPSTEYSVPTGKHLSMPEQENRSPLDTIHHELGHAMIGQNEGLTQEGMLRHTHIDLPKGRVRAAVRWNASDLYYAGRPRPEKVPNLIRTFMGGISADEIRGLPRAANPNFNPSRAGSDGSGALRTLQSAGYDTSRALEIMHQAIDANKEYLTHPAVRSVIDENAPFRERDLSTQYHFSPERLSSMHAEAQRRMTNAGPEAPNNGAVNGENLPVRGADVAGAKSSSATGTGQGVSAEKAAKLKTQEIIPPEEVDLRPEILANSHGKAFLDIDGGIIGHGQEHEDTLRELGMWPEEPKTENDAAWEKFYDKQYAAVDNVVKAGVIRLAGLGEKGPLYVQVSKMPTEQQRTFIAKAIRNQDGVIWDIAPKGMLADDRSSIISGEGKTPGDFLRALDKEFSPALTTNALKTDVQKSTRPSGTGSTVKLMDNPLPIKGTGESGAPNTADVAQALSKYTTSKSVPLKLGEAKPSQMVKRGAALGEDEARYQLAQNNSGEDWYRSDMLKHDQEIQSIRPEFEDPIKISLFKWSEAVLSSGHKPLMNVKKGLQNWDHYTETGKFSPLNVNYDPNRPISDDNRASWGVRNARCYGNAMESLNRLVAEKGEQGAVEWLLAEHPLSELRQWMASSQTPVRGKATDTQPGYMILGAKRGPFGANLHGIETKFTADQWVSRTWNRWMGTIETNPNRPGELTTDSPRNSTERSLMQQSFQKTADKLGKSLSSMQAVLWYYEQALYTAHGVPKESWNFADAAKRVAQQDREAGIFKPEEMEEPEKSESPLSFMKVHVPKGHPILKEK